jgi:hypothetical protein
MTLPAKSQLLHFSSDLEFCGPPQGLFGLQPQSDMSGGPFNFLNFISWLAKRTGCSFETATITVVFESSYYRIGEVRR